MTRSLTLEDCTFYHSMTLPTGEEVRGEWDLRPRTSEYLGGVAFQGRRVLEIGPASGYLSFYMEQAGATVTCIEPRIERLWDFVPLRGFDSAAWQADFKPLIERVRNSFWYVHDLLGSAVKVVEAEPYDLPADLAGDLGAFDIGLLGAVLLHCRDPFQLLAQTARFVGDTMIVTDAYFPDLGTEPVCLFFPSVQEPQIHTWWRFTPQFFVRALDVLGFPHAEISYHEQLHHGHGHALPMFTVVARRAP